MSRRSHWACGLEYGSLRDIRTPKDILVHSHDECDHETDYHAGRDAITGQSIATIELAAIACLRVRPHAHLRPTDDWQKLFINLAQHQFAIRIEKQSH